MARLFSPAAYCVLSAVSSHRSAAFSSALPHLFHPRMRFWNHNARHPQSSKRSLTTSWSTKETPSSSSSSSITTKITESDSERSIRRRSNKLWRRPVSSALSVVGFVHSSARALFVRGRPSQWRKAVRELLKYLQETGLDQEWKAALLNVRLLDNIRILHRLEAEQGDRRELAALPTSIEVPDMRDALRYMKFATAVYGDAMIRAAEMDLKGKVDPRILPVTRTRISEHCSIAEDDIVVLDVDYKGNSKHLRHLVALDRQKKKIVLAIRGTYTFSEVAADIAAFTRPFCSGEAHSEMANMAESIWEETGPRILLLLQENPAYQLVICGHSLGAGVACLLHVLLEEKRLVRDSHCFAFAAPPTYTTLPASSSRRCTNYIFQNDVVPFLSVHAVRQYFQRISFVEDQHLSWSQRFSMIRNGTGIEELAQQAVVRNAPDRKPGAPVLLIPAAANVWIREDSNGLYSFRACDSRILADLGIALELSMTQDHIPSQYEQALSHYIDDEDEELVKPNSQLLKEGSSPLRIRSAVNKLFHRDKAKK